MPGVRGGRGTVAGVEGRRVVGYSGCNVAPVKPSSGAERAIKDRITRFAPHRAIQFIFVGAIHR
jgi:hypothetical protein